MRLDQAVVQAGLATSRNIAAQLIKSGMIEHNGIIVIKPAFDVHIEDVILSRAGHVYVGRAAYKLKAFLASGVLNVHGMCALDVGASTGGFSEVLLEQGIAQVTALDVGHDQLHPRIKNDPRVISIEGQDVRAFDHAPFELLTCDVSFISVLHILEALHKLSAKHVIILFKPQFEVGATIKRNRSGVVQDQKAIHEAKVSFEAATQVLNWKLIACEASQLEGKEGNREYFYYFRRNY